MAERTTTMAAPRPLLRRVISFREPLLLIPYLPGFLGAAASAFFGSYSSFLHSFARSLFPAAAAAAKCACAYACAGADVPPCHSSAEEDDDAALSREEVEAIMARIGVAATGRGGGGEGLVGRDEVARLFDAEEPSFAEVRRAFAVFDADRDGFIGAADLRGALARLGVREDDAACRAMIAAAGGGRDGRMSLFQFVTFLETGLC
jgi:calmodulin